MSVTVAGMDVDVLASSARDGPRTAAQRLENQLLDSRLVPRRGYGIRNRRARDRWLPPESDQRSFGLLTADCSFEPAASTRPTTIVPADAHIYASVGALVVLDR